MTRIVATLCALASLGASPTAWSAAIAELEKHPAVVHNLFKSPEPTGDHLRRAAEQARLHDPTSN